MKLLLAAALAASVAGPVSARAVAPGGQVTTTVAVPQSGLDLDRAADARLMLARLDRAAARVCGASPFSARDHQAAVRRTACYREAMERAMASMNAPEVVSLYRERAPQVATR